MVAIGEPTFNPRVPSLPERSHRGGFKIVVDYLGMRQVNKKREFGMTPEAARDFRLQLQQAREYALKDAEAFDGIIHAIERLGSFRLGCVEGLGCYQDNLVEFARLSPLAERIPAEWRSVHTPFTRLYIMVKDARNDAMHFGASARHLTIHAIEAALVLEDALRMVEESRLVRDYMIPGPVCARLWQPISLVRQQMLTNSFTYLPVQDAAGIWCLVSDLQIAKFLQCQSNNERRRRLATPLKEAEGIVLCPAACVDDSQAVEAVMPEFDGRPILVVRKGTEVELLGIVTAFDLL